MSGRTLRVLWHLMRADFLERVRRRRFLVLVALTGWFAFIFVPPADAGYATVAFGAMRGVYTSGWIGMMMGLVTGTGLSLFAFYVVKDGIARDRQTRVGAILASTPLSRPAYLAGKWLSNTAVLAALLAILSVMAMGMQLVRGEEMAVRPLELLAPLWLMGLPTLALVAAVAVVFETVPFLAGGLGNVAYFFGWVWMLGVLVSSFTPSEHREGFAADPLGIRRPMAAVQARMAQADPAYEGGVTIGRTRPEGGVRTVRVEDLGLDARYALERMAWIAAALGLSTVGALWFDRFDPSRREGTGRVRAVRAWLRGRRRTSEDGETAPSAPARTAAGPAPRLSPLERVPGGALARFATVATAEAKLLLRGWPWWWYAGVAGLWIAAAVAEMEGVKRGVLPLTYLWPLLLFSALGTRERRHDTGRLLFCAPRPLARQLPATWAAGVGVALVLGAALAVRFALAGEWGHVAGLAVGAAFAPTLAMALGTWSGQGRLFEIAYLVLWYGMFSGGAAVDFLGASAEAQRMGMPLVFAGVTAALGAAAVLGRRSALARGG